MRKNHVCDKGARQFRMLKEKGENQKCIRNIQNLRNELSKVKLMKQVFKQQIDNLIIFVKNKAEERVSKFDKDEKKIRLRRKKLVKDIYSSNPPKILHKLKQFRIDFDQKLIESIKSLCNSYITSFHLSSTAIPPPINLDLPEQEQYLNDTYGIFLEGHYDHVNCAVISNDNTFIVSGSSDKSLRVWDLSSKTQKFILGTSSSPITTLSISSDDNYLVSGSENSTVSLWNLPERSLISHFKGHSQRISKTIFAFNTTSILSSSSDKSIILWTIANRSPFHHFLGHELEVLDLKITWSGRFLISCSCDKNIIMWDLETYSKVEVMKGHSAAVNCLDIAADDTWIVSGSYDNTLRFWSMITRLQTRVVYLEGYGGCFALISSNIIVYSAPENYIKFFSVDLADTDCSGLVCEEQVIGAHNDKINCIRASKDGKYVVSCSGFFSNSEDNSITVWDMTRRTQECKFQGITTKILCLAITSDSKCIISGSSDTFVRIWDVGTRRSLSILKDHSGKVLCVAVTRDSKYIISGSEDSSINLWDTSSKKLLKKLVGHRGPVRCLILTQRDKLIVSGSSDGTIRGWGIDSVQERFRFCNRGEIISMGITADEEFLVTSSADRALRLWSLRASVVNECVSFESEAVINCFLLARKDSLLIYTLGAEIIIRNIKRKKKIASLEGHTGQITGLCTVKQEKYLISSSFDGMIRLWSLNKYKSLGIIDSSCSGFVRIAYSPQNSVLVSCFNDKIKFYYLEESIKEIKILKLRNKCKLDTSERCLGHSEYYEIYRDLHYSNAPVLRISLNWSACILILDKMSYVVTQDKDLTIRIWSCNTSLQEFIGADPRNLLSKLDSHQQLKSVISKVFLSNKI